MTPGPGQYVHERADSQVKPRSFETQFNHYSERKKVAEDPDNGPGTHEENRNFGYDTLDHTIRVKYYEKLPRTPGPGEY